MLIEYVIYEHGTVILEIGWCDDNYMLHAIYTHLNRPWNSSKDDEMNTSMQTKIIFISLFVFLLLLLLKSVLKALWDNSHSIRFRSLRMRCSSSCFHKQFPIMISFVQSSLDCASADVGAVATVTHRNDSDYNNNYKFRKSKWASRKTKKNKRSGRHNFCTTYEGQFLVKIVHESALPQWTNINKEIFAYSDAVNTIYYQRWRLSRKTINLYFAWDAI